MEEQEFSTKECEILVMISEVKNKDFLNFTTLAKELKLSSTNPSFARVLKTLLSKEIIEIKKIVGSSKIIKINHNKLVDLIDDQEQCVFWYEYFKSNHIISW